MMVITITVDADSYNKEVEEALLNVVPAAFFNNEVEIDSISIASCSSEEGNF